MKDFCSSDCFQPLLSSAFCSQKTTLREVCVADRRVALTRMGGRRPRKTGKYCTTQFFHRKVIVRPRGGSS